MTKFNYNKELLYKELVSIFPYERNETLKSFVKSVPSNCTIFNRNKANAQDYLIRIMILNQDKSSPRVKNLKDLTSMIEPQIKLRKSEKFQDILTSYFLKACGY